MPVTRAPTSRSPQGVRAVNHRADDTYNLHIRTMRHLMHLMHLPRLLPVEGRCATLLVPLIVLSYSLSVSAGAGGVTHSCTLWMDGTKQQVSTATLVWPTIGPRVYASLAGGVQAPACCVCLPNSHPKDFASAYNPAASCPLCCCCACCRSLAWTASSCRTRQQQIAGLRCTTTAPAPFRAAATWWAF